MNPFKINHKTIYGFELEDFDLANCSFEITSIEEVPGTTFMKLYYYTFVSECGSYTMIETELFSKEFLATQKITVYRCVIAEKHFNCRFVFYVRK